MLDLIRTMDLTIVFLLVSNFGIAWIPQYKEVLGKGAFKKVYPFLFIIIVILFLNLLPVLNQYSIIYYVLDGGKCMSTMD